jgi:hypothetical protein
VSPLQALATKWIVLSSGTMPQVGGRLSSLHSRSACCLLLDYARAQDLYQHHAAPGRPFPGLRHAISAGTAVLAELAMPQMKPPSAKYGANLSGGDTVDQCWLAQSSIAGLMLPTGSRPQQLFATGAVPPPVRQLAIMPNSRLRISANAYGTESDAGAR